MTTHANLSRVSGPLVEHATGFAEELRRRGYTKASADNQLWLLAHLSRWLAEQRRQTWDLTPTRARAFLRVRRRAGYTALLTGQGIAPLLGYLREIGPPEVTMAREPDGPVEVLFERYRHHLVGERGLTASTVEAYERNARCFLPRSNAETVDL